jgi:glycosyltransferase involved in cell wall biosynthesis
VIIAAIFSRVQKDIPVVFRVMGVNKLMRASTSGFKVYHYIYRWAYRSPFSLVVCTQDGSGVEKWASQVLSTRSRVEIFINGTDDLSLDGNIDSILKNLPHNRVIIMFVGKLEKYKGCYEFVEAILNLVANKMTNIHALIIGSGTEEKKIVELVNNAGASIFFTFIKLLSHSQILHAHSICDIYVSMNHLGNLSNANLEAIQSNDCIIIPKPQQDNGIDKVTASLLGNSIISVPIKQPDELSNALSILIRSKSKRKIMEGRIKAIKKNFIWSWNERIKAELDIIKDLKNSHNLNE